MMSSFSRDKLRFQNVFRPHGKKNPGFFKFVRFEDVFEKLGYCDGLVWTESLTLEIELRFHIPQHSVIIEISVKGDCRLLLDLLNRGPLMLPKSSCSKIHFYLYHY